MVAVAAEAAPTNMRSCPLQVRLQPRQNNEAVAMPSPTWECSIAVPAKPVAAEAAPTEAQDVFPAHKNKARREAGLCLKHEASD
jgi:hypothetical protein